MALGAFLAGEEGSPREGVRIGGRLTGKRVFVPLLSHDQAKATDQVRVALAICQVTDGELVVSDALRRTEDAERRITSSADREEREAAVAWAQERVAMPTSDRLSDILSARRTENWILERLRTGSYDTLILPGNVGGPLTRRRLRRLANRVPCNVLTVNGQGEFRKFASILLPIANGPHSGLATDVAAAIAAASDAYIDVLHVLPPEPDAEQRRAAEERTEVAVERIGRPETASPWVLEADDPVQEIVTQSTYYGLTVIGAPTVGPLHRLVYGSASRTIRDRADSAVIAAQTPSHTD